MPTSRADLADFTYFLAIARHRNFRSAGLELGVSASALSHALKGLEARLGVRLFNRTNRSVTLTAAGEELRAGIDDPFQAIGRTVAGLDRFRERSSGRIRVNVMEHAADLLLGHVLPVFVERHPDMEVEVSVNNRMVDVVGEGFDAGIRYGGTVPADMIAQRLSPDLRWVVAGAPSYFERFGTPAHPDDLARHRCLNFRLGDGRPYRWEFEQGGEAVDMQVPGGITVDVLHLLRRLAVGGAGLVYAPELCIAPEVQDSSLRVVLGEWAPMGPGFFIYYSSRNQVPPGLKLLIELIKELHPV